MHKNTYTLSVNPRITIYFQGDLVLGSTTIDDLRALCALPADELNFDHVRDVDEFALRALTYVIAAASEHGQCPTCSGTEHNLLLMWTLVLAAAAPQQDTAYKC